MSPEKQRVAIAIACRWKDCDINWLQKPALLLGSKPTFHNGKIISYLVDQTIPHYPSDLNACHEMEKVLDEGQKERFGFWINHLHPFADIHYSEKKKDIQREVFSLVHATAAQRAKAFLLTLGLWQETKTQPQ